VKNPFDKKSNVCTIYIVRHGETEWNRQKIIQGHLDSPLTKAGLFAAKDLADKLKAIKFAACYSSDLLRAKKTAKIIAKEHQLIVKTTKALRERKLGRFEGKSIDYLQKELQKAIVGYKNLVEAELNNKCLPDIESHQKIIERFISFVRQVALAYPRKNVLLVTHAGVIVAFLAKMAFATHQELRTGTISNLAQIVLLSDGVEFYIKETIGIKPKTL
jgi:2,3-bisphosphoglycerate-dependent phosphoglycerate mutase